MPLPQKDHNNGETSTNPATEEFLDEEAIGLRAMENDEYKNSIQQFLLSIQFSIHMTL